MPSNCFLDSSIIGASRSIASAAVARYLVQCIVFFSSPPRNASRFMQVCVPICLILEVIAAIAMNLDKRYNGLQHCRQQSIVTLQLKSSRVVAAGAVFVAI